MTSLATMKLDCYGDHLKPSLVVANGGTHTLGTFEKHPHFAGQIAPSEYIYTVILAGNSLNIRSYTDTIYGPGKP